MGSGRALGRAAGTAFKLCQRQIPCRIKRSGNSIVYTEDQGQLQPGLTVFPPQAEKTVSRISICAFGTQAAPRYFTYRSIKRSPRMRSASSFFSLRAEILNLHRHAAEARALASTFSDADTIKDLENFAQSLDQQAAGLEKDIPPLEKVS